MKTRFAKNFVLVVAVLSALPAVAWAHAFLDHAEPRVGSHVAQPPTQVKIWFTQELEPDFSTIQVWDASGKEVDKQDTHADTADKTLLIVSLNAVPVGTYRVSWRVVASDTHTTQGEFKFTVRPAASSQKGAAP